MEQTNQGWVYIFVNQQYRDNIVKIGKTQRTIEDRLKEANKPTYVAQLFEVYYSRFFENCHQAEKDIHNYLQKDRVKEMDKEFFHTNPLLAMQVVDRFFYEEKFNLYQIQLNEQKEKITQQDELIYQQKQLIETLETKLKPLEEVAKKIKLEELKLKAKNILLAYKTDDEGLV